MDSLGEKYVKIASKKTKQWSLFKFLSYFQRTVDAIIQFRYLITRDPLRVELDVCDVECVVSVQCNDSGGKMQKHRIILRIPWTILLLFHSWCILRPRIIFRLTITHRFISRQTECKKVPVTTQTKRISLFSNLFILINSIVARSRACIRLHNR